MTQPDSFCSKSKFYGDKYFPYGIARSGEFTQKQVGLLENHGRAYSDLHHGLRSPTNDEEARFLLVCQGLETAVTEHEKVWKLFCQKTQAKPAISPFGGQPVIAAAETDALLEGEALEDDD